MLLEVQWENCYTIWLCCFLAGIYACMRLFGCHNKSTCFQKFKSSNVFYARARQMMPVAKRPAGQRPPQELGAKQLVSYIATKYNTRK